MAKKSPPRKRVKGYTRADGTKVKGYLRERKPAAPTLKSRKPSTKIPKGFKKVPRKPLGPLPDNIDTIQSIAAAQQRHSLMGAARELDRERRVTTAVHVHKNRDGTVDGELRVSNIKRGYKIVDLLTDISVALHGGPPDYSEWKLPENAGHWVSVGGLTDWGGTKDDWQANYDAGKKRGLTDAEARQVANAASSPLPRYRGQSRVALYPQRVVDLPANIFRAQQGLLGEAQRDKTTGKALGRGQKTKPTEILIRVYWNPWNVSPKNVGGRGSGR